MAKNIKIKKNKKKKTQRARSEVSKFYQPLLYSQELGMVFTLCSGLNGLPRWFSDKSLPTNIGDARDMGSVPGSGNFSAEGNGNPLQC